MSWRLSSALSVATVAACQSFGNAPVADAGDAGAAVADAAAPDSDSGSPLEREEGGAFVDAPPSACRTTFNDDFERVGISGGGWTSYPTGLGAGIAMDLDSTIAAAGSKSLKLVLDDDRLAGTSSYFLTKVDEPLADPQRASCPIQIAFDLRRGLTAFGDGDFVTFVSIELTDSTAVFLTLQKDGFRLYEQEDGGTTSKSVELAMPPLDAFTHIVLRYDPRPVPPIATVAIGTEQPIVYPTQIPKMGKPVSVRVGAAYATLGTAATLWLDNLRID